MIEQSDDYLDAIAKVGREPGQTLRCNAAGNEEAEMNGFGSGMFFPVHFLGWIA